MNDSTAFAGFSLKALSQFRVVMRNKKKQVKSSLSTGSGTILDIGFNLLYMIELLNNLKTLKLTSTSLRRQKRARDDAGIFELPLSHHADAYLMMKHHSNE